MRSQSKSWKLLIVVIGLLTICLSPMRAQAGQSVNFPLFFGGIITTIVGFIAYRKDRNI